MILSKQWLFAWLVLVVVVGLLALGIRRVQVASQRAMATNDLIQLWLGMDFVVNDNKDKVPICKAESSWRFRSAYAYESYNFGSAPDFDLPWHLPPNIRSTTEFHRQVHCGEAGGTFTKFMLVVESGQILLQVDGKAKPPRILVVEVRQEEIDWRACGDIEVEKLATDEAYRKKIAGWLQQPRGEFLIACTDGSFHAVPNSQAERFLNELVDTRDVSVLERVRARRIR